MSTTELLRSAQRSRFLNDIRSVQPCNKWKVIVMDRQSRSYLRHVIPESDLLDENVTAIEQLENVRDPYTEFEAIYFIQSSHTSFKCIAKDFESNNMYSKAHVRVSGPYTQSMIRPLESEHVSKFIASVYNSGLNFIAREQRVFETGDKFSFLHLYNPNCEDLCRPELASIASKIVSVCVTLGEYPVIRYYDRPAQKGANKGMVKFLAERLKDELESYVQSHSNFSSNAGRPRAILLLADRQIDTIAPLVHEFTYQAMAYDLMDIRDHKMRHTFESKNGPEDRTVELSEDDALYAEIRHLHMKDAIDKLMNDFNEFCRKNQKFVSADETAGLSDIRAMLAGLSEFQEQRDDFSLHLGIAQSLMDHFQGKDLTTIAEIEQDLATGSTMEGRVPRNAFERMVPLLDGGAMSNLDKVRLVMLFILYRGGIFNLDLKRIARHSKLTTRDVEAIKNMEIFGERVIKTDKDVIEHTKPKVINADTYELSRFVPNVKQVLQEQLSGSLDPESWHYIGFVAQEDFKITPQQSLRSARPTWARPNAIRNTNKQRMILFVIGGMTWSEIRSAYEVSESSNREIIIGSTHTVSPGEYINLLKMVKEPRSMLDLPKDKPVQAIPVFQKAEPPITLNAKPTKHERVKNHEKHSKSEKHNEKSDKYRISEESIGSKSTSSFKKPQITEHKKRSKKFGIF